MSRRNNTRGNNQELQRMDMGMMDPFTEMRQMRRGFGGFQDNFMRDMVPFGFGSDPFEDMHKFSDGTSILTQSIRTFIAKDSKVRL